MQSPCLYPACPIARYVRSRAGIWALASGHMERQTAGYGRSRAEIWALVPGYVVGKQPAEAGICLKADGVIGIFVMRRAFGVAKS